MVSFLEPLLISAEESSSNNVALLPPPAVLTGLLLASPIVAAAIQGGTAIVNFRKNYADAPLPRIPCHGVVIAAGDEQGTKPSSADDSCRLLVIGDSLAVGVGQSVSCTPVMPEAIASQISKTTGKPVFWTCFGETGASTPWIIRMIEEANTQKYPEFMVPDDPKASGYSNFYAKASESLSSKEIEEWKKKLFLYRQTFRELYFDPEAWGRFDIVVLVTGTNDLKAAIFPFLLDEEDKELRRLIKARKGGLIKDVELFIDVLNRKMERGIQRTLDEVMATAEEFSETMRRGFEEMELMFDNSTDTGANEERVNRDAGKTGVEAASPVEGTAPPSNASLVRPLFVLPGSPIRIVPSFRRAPLSWFGVPVFDFMDDKKRKFAVSNPSDILFVEDPTPNDTIEYESQRGRLWNEKAREKLLLRVKDVTPEECDGIGSEMKTYYDSKNVLHDTVNCEVPLSEWPGKPGTNVFSVDSIHPNEAGYDMWGRHIGLAIARQLEEKKNSRRDNIASIRPSPAKTKEKRPVA